MPDYEILNSSFNKDSAAKFFPRWDELGFPRLNSNFKGLVGKMMELEKGDGG